MSCSRSLSSSTSSTFGDSGFIEASLFVRTQFFFALQHPALCRLERIELLAQRVHTFIQCARALVGDACALVGNTHPLLGAAGTLLARARGARELLALAQAGRKQRGEADERGLGAAARDGLEQLRGLRIVARGR